MRQSTHSFAAAVCLGIALAATSAQAADPGMSTRSEPLSGNGAAQIADAPGIRRVVGPVRSSACDARYDPARGEAEALKQLQTRALAHGGDGVTDVRFTQITNTRSPCWHGVEATGLAVVYAR